MAERGKRPILIKRYGRSRLYDTHAARYVTLDEIADLVRAEKTVAVYDAASDQDLTPLVLARIVAGYH